MPCKIGARMSCQQKRKLYAVITQLHTRLRSCGLDWTGHRNEENTYTWKYRLFCAPPSPGTNRRQVSLAVFLEIDECNMIHNPSSRWDTYYDQRPLVKPLSNSSQLLAYRVPTCQILESSSGRTPHVVRDRSASELRAERKSLGDHNSAPQANQTLRLELSGSLQAGEHIWRKNCVSSAPFFPWKSGVSTIHVYAKS